jgi:hypothetical protein
MHDAAGNRSGEINIASTTVNRIAAVLRIDGSVAQTTARVERVLSGVVVV